MTVAVLPARGAVVALHSAFGFGDRVEIDGGGITATVVGIAFYAHGYELRVSWWNNGEMRTEWIADFRLTLVKTADVQ